MGGILSRKVESCPAARPIRFPLQCRIIKQMRTRISCLLVLSAVVAAAHPMGNFSVNHYARIEPDAHGAHIRYVLDLAEIPTFELFQQWGASRDKALEQ